MGAEEPWRVIGAVLAAGIEDMVGSSGLELACDGLIESAIATPGQSLWRKVVTLDHAC